MAIQQAVVNAVAQLQTGHVLAIVVAIGAVYYFSLRPPRLNLPVVIPDPGPEGVFNTLTRSYEEVSKLDQT